MSATVAPRRRAGARSSVLGRALAAELIKITTLRGWWIGLGVLLALTVAFAVASTSLIVDQVGALGPSASFTDLDGSQLTVERAVLNGVLAPTYQSAAFFLPVLVALAVGQEHRRRQVLVSAAAVPSRLVLFAAKLIAVALASVAVCLLSCVLGDVVLLVMLPPRLDAVVLSPAGLLVPVRTAVYAISVAVLAAALTSILRSTLFALFAAVALFLITATGLFASISPVMNAALPIIGAQSFLFGYVVEPEAPGRGAGLLILLAWTVVPAVVWAITFTRRDLA